MGLRCCGLLGLALLLAVAVAGAGAATPRARQLFVVSQAPVTLTDHHGQLLTGNYSVNLLWYGRFTPAQRATVADFVLSLSSDSSNAAASGSPAAPSVASWWTTTSRYHPGAARLILGRQVLDTSLSLGGRLSETALAALAARLSPHRGSVAVVVTAPDVLVDGFCLSRCGLHASATSAAAAAPAPARGAVPTAATRGRGRFAYVWVGNAAEQCPGECAWPFHQPTYGPQAPPPLVAPNADVGMDGVVINLATLLAGAVTNPYGGGYFQGPTEAPLEAVTACTGMFGAGAYPGYPGQLPVDAATGASYNAVGVAGRRFLLPAMWDPKSSQCSTLV